MLRKIIPLGGKRLQTCLIVVFEEAGYRIVFEGLEVSEHAC